MHIPLSNITNVAKNVSKKPKPKNIRYYSEYIHSSINHFLQIEAKLCPNPDYLMLQNELSSTARSDLFDWIIGMHHNLDMTAECLFFTFNLIDRFLSCRAVSIDKLRLVGIGSFLIAAKYEEVSCPSIETLIDINNSSNRGSNDDVNNFNENKNCNNIAHNNHNISILHSKNTFTIDEIKKAETYILHVLDCHIEFPSPISFIKIALSEISSKSSSMLFKISNYLLERMFLDDSFLRFPGSVKAVSSCLIASKVLETVTYSMKSLVGSNFESVDSCVRLAERRFVNGRNFPRLTEKYLRSDVLCLVNAYFNKFKE